MVLRAMNPERSSIRNFRWLLVIPFLIACSSRAQQPSTPAESGLMPGPTAALRAFEPAVNAPYELGRGDEITIDALGRPELTGKHVIGPDGQVTLPIVGAVKIAGLTREDASAEIERVLGAYYSGVSISISVDRYTSNQIVLLGAVEHPGVLTFDNTPTLLEVISRGGISAAGSNVVGQSDAGSRPSGVPEQCTIYRGNDTMVTVQLAALLDEGSPLANMRLKRDDIVFVNGRTSYVSVLGQVTHPGNLRLQKTSSLADLMAQAGGPTEKAGHNPSIEIIHQPGSPGPKSETVPFNTLVKQNTQDVTLRSGDIIYVPESGFNKASYTFQQIAPLVNLFTVGALFSQ
jgi:polysaccharide export outer membrane protein